MDDYVLDDLGCDSISDLTILLSEIVERVELMWFFLDFGLCELYDDAGAGLVFAYGAWVCHPSLVSGSRLFVAYDDWLKSAEMPGWR